MAGSRLVETMQKASRMSPTKTCDLVFGEVISLSPLEIKVDGRFNIGEQFILLSVLCREQIITVTNIENPKHEHIIRESVTLPSGEDEHIHKIEKAVTEKALSQITLWRGLKVGDKVRMLRVSEGGLFYVIERDGDLE